MRNSASGPDLASSEPGRRFLRVRRGLALGLAALATCLASGRASSVVVEARRVVDLTTLVPGGPFEPGSSSTFTTLFPGSAASGRLVFRGWVQDSLGLILGQGLYSVDVGGGELAIVADTRTCADDPCPPENLFERFGDVYSFDGTTVGFDATWNPPSGPQGVWTATGAARTLAVRDGDANPSGGSFDILGSPAIDGNEIAFVERSFVAENGIFAAPASGGSARVVADGSTAAPGAGGALFDPSSFTRIAYRDGLLVFRGELDDDSEGLYAEDDGGLRVVADASIVAPGLDGETFTSIASAVTDGGDIVFLGGTPSVAFGGRGIYVERNGTLLPTPIAILRSSGGTVDPCDPSTRLLFAGSLALGDGAVAFVAEGALFSARIGTAGLSRLLVEGDTVDGKTVDSLGLHPEAVSDGAVFPLISFADGSAGTYCLGIPETPQCSAAPVPVRCLPEPGALAQGLMALAGLGWLRRRRRA